MQCHAATDVKKIENYLASLDGPPEKIDLKRVERDASYSSSERFGHLGFGHGGFGHGGYRRGSSSEEHRYGGGFGGFGNYPYYYN